MQYIHWLSKIKEKDIALVGGKAMNLGRLMSLGLCVPEGFCITTDGYETFVKETKTKGVLREILQSCEKDEAWKLGVYAQKCQEIIRSQDIPAILKDEICEAYYHLSQGRQNVVPVAIRSSANAEDLPQASFAGQYDTILNVHNEEELFESVKNCWASLWSEWALQYRCHHHISNTDIGMAALIQEMVMSDVSGIMFTANPVNGSRGEIVINASFGLGDIVVSGVISSDTYIVRKSDCFLLQSKIASKHLKVIAKEKGGTLEIAMNPEQRDIPALEERHIVELVTVGRIIEEHFGCPQDIEWAYSTETLHLLQSRPVTTLMKEDDFPIVWVNPHDSSLPWIRAGADEIAPRPLCPWDVHMMMIWADAFNEARKSWHSIFTYRLLVMNGYLYTTDVPFLLSDEKISAHRAAYESAMEQLMDTVPQRWYKEWQPEIECDFNAWSRFNRKEASLSELLVYLYEMLLRRKRHEYIGAVVGVVSVPALDSFTKLFNELFGSNAGIDGNRLLQGFKSKVHEVEEALWDLARQVEQETELSQIILRHEPEDALLLIRRYPTYWQLLESFLTMYGYYGGSDNLITPPWREEPTLLLSILRQKIRQPEDAPSIRLQCLAQDREVALSDAINHLSSNQRQLDRFLLALKRAQECIPISQDRYVVIYQMGYFILRQILLEIGRRFVEASWIERPEEIFYLTVNEVLESDRDREKHDWRRKIATRREELRRFEKIIPPKTIGTPPTPLNPTMKYQADAMYPAPEEFQTREYENANQSLQTGIVAGAETQVLRGMAGSPGRYKGPARVIHSIHEAGQVTRGDILVCPMTTPAWTALFGIIGGVVTEMGSILSHPAVIAREFGIPAVIGTEIATKVIANNQIVTVDGSTGSIYLSV